MSDSEITAAAAAAEGLNLGRPQVGSQSEATDLQKRKIIQRILNQLTAKNFPELLGNLLKEIDSLKALETVQSKLYEAVIVCEQQTAAYAPERSTVTLIQLYADVCLCIHHENQRTNPRTSEPGKLFFQSDGPSEEAHGGQFRSMLVNRCQEEFERLSIPLSMQDEWQRLSKGDRSIKLSDEKRRLFCNVEFVSQLYKNGLLASATVLNCLKVLLETHYEHSSIFFEQPGNAPPRDMEFQQLEAFCSLLKSAGLSLDQPEVKDLMDGYFRHLEHVMKQPTISSRMKFAIRDIIELRSCNWDPQLLPAAHGQETAAHGQLHSQQPYYPTDSELSEAINAIWSEEPNKHVKAVAGCIMSKRPTWSFASSRVISIVESKNAHRLPSCAPPSAAVSVAAATSGGGVPWNPSPRSIGDGVGASNEDCSPDFRFISHDEQLADGLQAPVSDKAQSSDHAFTRIPPAEWPLVSDKDGSSDPCKYIPPPGFCSKRIHVFVDLSNVEAPLQRFFSEKVDEKGKKVPDFRFGIEAPKLANIVERGKEEVDTKVVSRLVIASVPWTIKQERERLAKEGKVLWKDWQDAGYHVIPFERFGHGEQTLDHSLRMEMQRCISRYGKGNPVDGVRKPVDKMVLVSGDNNADGLPDDPVYRVTFGDILEEAISKGFEVEVWSWSSTANRAFKKDLPAKHGALFKTSFLDAYRNIIVSRPLEPPTDSGTDAASLPKIANAPPPPSLPNVAIAAGGAAVAPLPLPLDASEPVSPSADKGCSNQSRSPVAASQSAVLHAPPADEQDSGRGRSPDAASGVGKSERKSRSRSKEGQKTETGAAVAPPAPDASEPVSPSRDVMREVPLALLTSHLIVCDCGNPASLIEPVLRAKWSGIVSLEVDDLRVLKITFQSQSSKMAAKEGISKALVLVTPISQQAMHGDLLSFDFEKFIAASLDRRNIQCALLSMSPVPAIGGVGGGFFLKFAHEEFVPIAVRVLSEDAEFLKFFRIVQLSSW